MENVSETQRLFAHQAADLDKAAALLREGGTVAFPTETVYGLGANALDPAAVAHIFEAKQRPAWDPLIVHVADFDQVDALADIPPALLERVGLLADAFWPGPLTLLLPRAAHVPDAVTAGRPLVGIRVPSHPVALALLEAAGIPVAAPSANTFGHTSPTTAAHVLADLDGRIDAVLDGGPTAVGLESTVLDPATMIVYRPGAVTLAQLAVVTGVVPVLFSAGETAGLVSPQSLPSPGVGIRHYAPRARVVLCDGSPEALSAAVAGSSPPDQIIGVMLPANWPLPIAAQQNFAWGSWSNPAQLAANLFAGLRALDDAGSTVIVCPKPAANGIGEAILDRLKKAARRD